MVPRHRCRRLARTLALAIAISTSAVAAEAQESQRPGYDARRAGTPSIYDMAVDLVVVRPLGLVPILVAPVGCLLGLPVAFAFETPGIEPLEICIEEPVGFSFTRPLGAFGDRE